LPHPSAGKGAIENKEKSGSSDAEQQGGLLQIPSPIVTIVA